MTNTAALTRALASSRAGTSELRISGTRSGSSPIPDDIPGRVPPRERWLYKNKIALKLVRDGIDDIRNGRVQDLGSFAQYASDDAE